MGVKEWGGRIAHRMFDGRRRREGGREGQGGQGRAGHGMAGAGAGLP